MSEIIVLRELTYRRYPQAEPEGVCLVTIDDDGFKRYGVMERNGDSFHSGDYYHDFDFNGDFEAAFKAAHAAWLDLALRMERRGWVPDGKS